MYHPPAVQYNKADNSVQIITDHTDDGQHTTNKTDRSQQENPHYDVLEEDSAQCNIEDTNSNPSTPYVNTEVGSRVGYEYHEVQFPDKCSETFKDGVQIPAGKTHGKETAGQASKSAAVGTANTTQWTDNIVYASSDDITCF